MYSKIRSNAHPNEFTKKPIMRQLLEGNLSCRYQGVKFLLFLENNPKFVCAIGLTVQADS